MKSFNDLRIEEGNHKLLDEEFDRAKCRILFSLRRLPASFLSEISWESNITEYETKNVLNRMFHEGLVEEIPVDWLVPDNRLLRRVPDQSAKGQAGYPNFSKKRWFGITKKGLDELVNGC